MRACKTDLLWNPWRALKPVGVSKIGLDSEIFIAIGWSLHCDWMGASGERVKRKCGHDEVILLMAFLQLT